MIVLVPDGKEIDPLVARAEHDGRRAEVSRDVAKALRGELQWAPTAQSVRDLRWDDEVRELLRICWAAEYHPGSLQPALLDYVKLLGQQQGLVPCAIVFAEIARDLAAESVSAELLMELARLYRVQCRWVEAGDTWEDVHRIGALLHNVEYQLRAMIGKAGILRHKGNLSGARDMLISVITDAYPYPEIRGMALNDLGDTYSHMHPPLLVEAALAFNEAQYLVGDPERRWVILSNMGIVAKDLRYYALADACLRLASKSSTCWNTQTNALIELVDLYSLMQNTTLLEYTRTTLRWRINTMGPDMQCDYRYRLGLMELRDGRNPAPDWQQGISIAQQNGLGEWVFKLQEALNAPPSGVRDEPVEEPRLIQAYHDIDIQCAMVGA